MEKLVQLTWVFRSNWPPSADHTDKCEKITFLAWSITFDSYPK